MLWFYHLQIRAIMLVRWLKRALPDAHCVIFELHAELAYQTAEKKINSMFAMELKTFGYIRYGFFDVTREGSIELYTAVCNATAADISYLGRSSRPNVPLYVLFKKCYDRLWVIKSLIGNSTGEKITELHQEELINLAQLCQIVEFFIDQ